MKFLYSVCVDTAGKLPNKRVKLTPRDRFLVGESYDTLGEPLIEYPADATYAQALELKKGIGLWLEHQ